MLNVVIIEDENLTALDLVNTLKRIDRDIEVKAILPSIEEAVLYLKNNPSPDLLFSDIQLPDGLSFEIFKQVSISSPVIFCTAYDQYALKAFEVNGIDYLLKPFSKNTVSKAIDKYRLLKGHNNHNQQDTFARLINMLEQKNVRSTNSIVVCVGDKIIPLEIESIALFYLEDNYVFAFTFEQKKHIVSQSLEELENLCGLSFFRANRQYLVNRKAIKDAAYYLNRKILVHLNFTYPNQILIGKLKKSQFLEWLAKS
jgi:two-component system, LytTR family, response regulator LytT